MFQRLKTWWNSLDDIIRQGWIMLGILVITVPTVWFLGMWLFSLLLK
jgi:hypothetical protein